METEPSKLVLCTGAPGSMWSRIVKELSRYPSVDNSDETPDRVYPSHSHFGNYFGPSMEFGEYFLELDESRTTRDEFLSELAKPYSAPFEGRYRLLKSHAFSYNLPFLERMLPDSRFLLIWRDDQECFDWWMGAGGFKITYPNYLSYQNEHIMRRQITVENESIRRYAEERNIELGKVSIGTLARQLGLVENSSGMSEWEKFVPDALIGVRLPGISAFETRRP